ncbi:hypothetical protein FHS43_001429 [Streptosporangium becharense]|uniref:Lipoprotein n=1 Tax=Streptosporangium becharense TaxID=1816182 RepID=A0A7W9IMS8_9ACTN|nr:hypothetical protein [Streptosporangium becharense]MBB2910166.1 hypothetical protein [Streptosporangium becharense]MBB5822909.1 hypothetical protein [Streptosporangium becharense]
MPDRHHVAATGLLGLCLALTAFSGSGGRAATATEAAGPRPAAVDPTQPPATGEPEGTPPPPGGTASPTPGGTVSPTPEPAPVPEGFKRIGGVENGLTVAVPQKWVALDLSKENLEEGLKRSGLTGDAAEQARRSLQTLIDNKGIWATDSESVKTSPNGFATNLNGFCQPVQAPAMDQLIRETKEQLEQLNAKVTEADTVRLGSAEAARIVYTFPAGGVDIRGTQYYLPSSGRTCIITLSTDSEDRQRLFDRIGRTMRLS